MNYNSLLKATFVSLCLLSFVLVCIANTSLEISEDLTIAGNGSFDRVFEVQSSPDFINGQKLIETILPAAYLARVNVTSTYSSSFEFIHSNNSSIFYESYSDLSDVKHYLSNENFEIGVYTGFYFIGTQNKSFLFESSPSLSEAVVLSKAEGRSVLRAKVANRSYYHYPIVDTRTWLEGNYSLNWNFLVLNPEYPEAGEADDYLACP